MNLQGSLEISPYLAIFECILCQQKNSQLLILIFLPHSLLSFDLSFSYMKPFICLFLQPDSWYLAACFEAFCMLAYVRSVRLFEAAISCFVECSSLF